MLTTERVESDLGCWRLTNYAPSPGDPLRGAVERIWHFEGRLAQRAERVFPDGTLEIVVQLRGGYRPIGDVPGEPFPPLSIGGQRTAALTIEGPGTPLRIMGIRLTPLAARALLNASLEPLTGIDLDLHDVLGRSAAELGERCAEARNAAGCVATTLDWLRARLEKAPPTPALVARAIAQIEAGGGAQTIAELDAFGSISRSRFTASFTGHVGVSPKRYARIVRFRRALELVLGGDAPLGVVAAQMGFYDQPHMNAEFRVHAGLTPRAVRRAQRYPNSASLVGQNFQDEDALTA